MASTAAHHSTGWAVGLIAAALVSRQIVDPFYFWTIATLVAGYAGGTAPDWLEHAWWSSSRGRRLWITHRTWTHWGVAWVGLMALSYSNLGTTVWAGPAFGFAAGGLMHLLADWPNPLGVPWLLTKRYSLKWWKSGRGDYFIIIVTWAAALATVDNIWWRGTFFRHMKVGALALVQAMPSTHLETLIRWYRSLL